MIRKRAKTPTTDVVRRPVPSLLESEATGGDTAEGGFTFQQGVILAQIPRWLEDEGFTGFTRESLGDTEAKFFVPGQGLEREFVEAKGYTVTPALFREEVARFRAIDQGSPGVYRRFILVTTGLSAELQPLVNGLRRIRDPHTFYGSGSVINDNSFQDWLLRAEQRGYSPDDARFLFAKVDVEYDFGGTASFGESVFVGALPRHLPEFRDLPNRFLTDIYAHLQVAIQNRLNRPIDRPELESLIRGRIEHQHLPKVPPIRVVTVGLPADDEPTKALRFGWTAFFGGRERRFPPAERWDTELVGGLHAARDWIARYRSTRRLDVKGERRLSAALALGSVFSAVAGFAIDFHHRDQVWATDAHTTASTPAFPLSVTPPRSTGERLIVSIGIPRAIGDEVDAAASDLNLVGAPTLHLHGVEPIISAEQANSVVGQVKEAIRTALASTGARQIDLFFAGPSFLALFLGHRLNATAPVQCYEWVGPGSYVATCRLFAN